MWMTVTTELHKTNHFSMEAERGIPEPRQLSLTHTRGLILYSILYLAESGADLEWHMGQVLLSVNLINIFLVVLNVTMLQAL